MQCHPKKITQLVAAIVTYGLVFWRTALPLLTPIDFLTKSVLLILTSTWNSIDRGSLENLETETATILTTTLR